MPWSQQPEGGGYVGLHLVLSSLAVYLQYVEAPPLVLSEDFGVD